MTHRRIRALLAALIAGAVLCTAGVPLAAAAGAKKADPHAKQEAPPKPEPRPEPLPIVDPKPLPSGRQAYEMMRELRQMQDEVAFGNADKMLAQRELIETMASEFERADDEVWKDPRNGRAALAFVLNGGDVKVLRGLLLRGQPSSIDQKLGRAIHAFASRRRGEAFDAFAGLNPLELDVTIAGQVALAQAELAARDDLDKALAKLDLARLVAPGTLIEEAALRRQISILSTQKKFERADKMLEIYFRRFPKSGYAGAIKRQTVRFIADRPPLQDAKGTQGIVAAFSRLSRHDALEIYLELAKEGAMRSLDKWVRFATGKALELASEGSHSRTRAQLYLAAMDAATLDAGKARTVLESIKDKIDAKDDKELAEAAREVTEALYRLNTSVPAEPEQPWRDELGKQFANVGKAHGLLSVADDLLKGPRK